MVKKTLLIKGLTLNPRLSTRRLYWHQMDTPTLIIHGTLDPFIPIEHGKKCADLIPDARTLWVDGMAHDLPNEYIDVIVEEMIRNFQRAE